MYVSAKIFHEIILLIGHLTAERIQWIKHTCICNDVTENLKDHNTSGWQGHHVSVTLD